ncbi:hypothetical protein ACFVFQ_24450 [Streptomyces sp. NPDC057743]|uniref:hypothetical protein n=1 Tax=Streptomyces sp. NPDC057743 TaxID=3346236 RepID=UPI00367DB253
MNITFVDELPGGRQVLPVECEGELVWFFARGAMTEEARDEMALYFRHLTDEGHWVQQWDGKRVPPQRRRGE